MIKSGVNQNPYTTLDDLKEQNEALDMETSGLDQNIRTFWKTNYPEDFEEAGLENGVLGRLFSNYKGIFGGGFGDMFDI